MNQMTTRPARAAAVQRSQDAIDQNVAKIEADRAQRSPAPQQQRGPSSALQIMAERLNVPPLILKSTLMNTVFKKATDDEFVALVIVANEYKLNPLTKEIYAFPAKGGGIVPIVSIDGWIRIMNEHPAFDGIEFTDIPDEKGNLMAIETIIYRKDRTRPIKVTEYLDECRQQTDPWKKMPARMLRHKALIQGARVAFGFSGIYSEDDDIIGDVGPATGPMPMRDVTPAAPREAYRAAISHDPETGEIKDEDEETARRLDAEGFAAMEGRDTSQMGEPHTTIDEADRMIAEINSKELVADVDAFMRDADLTLLDDDQAARVEEAADRRTKALRASR